MYTLRVMVHSEFLQGPLTTISRRDLLKRGAVLAITASVVGAIVTNQDGIVDSGISRSSKPTVPTTPTMTDHLRVERVDLFKGGSLPEGMTTSIQTPGTASPKGFEKPQIVK